MTGSTSPLLAATCVASSMVAAAQQSPFLKEILLGRCYARPPSGNAADVAQCPSSVASLVSVIESRLDDHINPDDFGQYLEAADLAPPTDGALLWPPAAGDGRSSAARRTVVLGANAVTVERTPGGSLLDGLAFCGVDRREDCPPPGGSGAGAAFWGGAYAAYSSRATGRIRAVAEADADLELLVSFAAPNLDPSAISSFEVFAVGVTCESEEAERLRDALHQQGVSSDLISCTEDNALLHLSLCRDSPESAACRCIRQVEEGDGQEEEEGEDGTRGGTLTGKQASSSKDGRGGSVYAVLFWVLLFAIAASVFVVWTHRTWSGYAEVPELTPMPKQ